MASANRALSILDLKPGVVSMDFSSSSLKMPVRRPVPMKVPMVSKVSDRLKEKMVTRTRGSLETSLNSDGRPAPVKITPKVEGSCLQASRKLTVSVSLVDGDAHGDAQQGGENNADEDGALDLADLQDDGQCQADQEQPEGRTVEGGQGRHAGVKADEAHIQDADVSHIDADAAADGVLQAAGNGLDDVFPDLGDRDQDV